MTDEQPISTIMSRLMNLSPEEEAQMEARAAAYDQEQADKRRREALAVLEKDLPANLQAATLQSYKALCAEQVAVKKKCIAIGHKLETFLPRNVLWLGTYGTGKDHMAAALLKQAVRIGFTARWREARDFYDDIVGEVRDELHGIAMRELAEPDVVCLSDPIFDRGWTMAMDKALNHLIRKRYDSGRAIWITCNVKRDSARELFGKDAWRRLEENAVIFDCEWACFTKPCEEV